MRCNQMLNKHNDKGIVVYIHQFLIINYLMIWVKVLIKTALLSSDISDIPTFKDSFLNMTSISYLPSNGAIR